MLVLLVLLVLVVVVVLLVLCGVSLPAGVRVLRLCVCAGGRGGRGCGGR